jgi:hypothetical protein
MRCKFIEISTGETTVWLLPKTFKQCSLRSYTLLERFKQTLRPTPFKKNVPTFEDTILLIPALYREEIISEFYAGSKIPEEHKKFYEEIVPADATVHAEVTVPVEATEN